MPGPPSGLIVRICAVVAKVREHTIAYNAPKSTTDGSLSVEQGKSFAEFEARVEEREIGYSDGIEASCRMLVLHIISSSTSTHTLKTTD